jgi:hypothetical protein
MTGISIVTGFRISVNRSESRVYLIMRLRVLSVGSRGALKRRMQFLCSEGERVPRISV